MYGWVGLGWGEPLDGDGTDDRQIWRMERVRVQMVEDGVFNTFMMLFLV